MGEALDFDSVGYEESREVVQVGTLDLDTVRPGFERHKQEAARIAADAKALTVQDQESLNTAVALGGNAKKIAKAIDAQRKAIILEPSEFVKGVNGLCKMITDSLDEAERITKQKIGQHQAKVELERREAERKAKEATEALQKKLDDEAAAANKKAADEAKAKAEEEARAKGASPEEVKAEVAKAEEDAAKIAVVAPTVVAPVVQEAAKVTRTESGSASQRKVWTFEIINEKAVPAEYRIIDEQLIKDAVRMGTRDIPGVRIFEETKVVFRT